MSHPDRCVVGGDFAHLDDNGCCDCGCADCTDRVSGWQRCICPDCDVDACGLHPTPDGAA